MNSTLNFGNEYATLKGY